MTLASMTQHTFTIRVRRDAETGSYGVEVPALHGIGIYGPSLDEALANAREGIALHVSCMEADGEVVPKDVPYVTVEPDDGQTIVAAITVDTAPLQAAAA